MRPLVCLLLAAAPLVAQFSNLTTDDTGDRVWFSSWLRLSGSQQNFIPKIFVADSSGNVQLVAQAATSEPHTYSLFGSPEVSGDGNTLAYQETYYCPPQLNCPYVSDFAMSTVNGYTRPGRFHLSRNGRYIAREGYSYSGPTAQFQIIDLTTQQARSVAIGQNCLQLSGGRQVTSTGSVLTVSDALWLFAADGSAQLVPTVNFSPLTYPAPTTFAQAAIDDLGDRIVYQATAPSCGIISTAASSAANPTSLVTSNLPCTLETLSADGSAALFVSATDFDGTNRDGLPECWVVDTTTKITKSVGHNPAGIAEATMSGDGKIVWAVTLAGRLIRIDRTTGATQEIIPRTTVLDQPLLSPTAAPGALAHLTGRGLASGYAASAAPLPTSLGGVQVLADGQPLPLLSVSPTDIVFQVPWEMLSFHTLTLNATPSPFEEVLSSPLNIWPSLPSFWSAPDGTAAIAHQDFHGLVTGADPAHPDEILHLYVTGLGAVRPPVPTGSAAPSTPLAMMVDTIHVYWAGDLPWNFPITAPVLFAGLAPGTVGLEQIDVQVPHEVPAQLGVSVQANGGSNAYATIPVR